MTEDRCPFCGAKLFWSQGQTKEYECNTLITESGLGPNFGRKCLESQIAKLTAKIEEVRRDLNAWQSVAAAKDKALKEAEGKLVAWKAFWNNLPQV